MGQLQVALTFNLNFLHKRTAIVCASTTDCGRSRQNNDMFVFFDDAIYLKRHLG